jgi:hypothetical protein
LNPAHCIFLYARDSGDALKPLSSLSVAWHGLYHVKNMKSAAFTVDFRPQKGERLVPRSFDIHMWLLRFSLFSGMWRRVVW